jgi:hypothetical protein
MDGDEPLRGGAEGVGGILVDTLELGGRDWNVDAKSAP